MITKKISKRGRPRGFDVEKAIAIATELFHQRGYDSVGVAELSKTIGITAPSLYAAFGSKRELFERVLGHYARGAGSWLPETLNSEETLTEAMTALFLRAAETYTSNPECPGCLVMDSTRNCNDDEVRSLAAGFRQVTRQLICDRITAGAPDLDPFEARALANYTIVILAGLSGSARDGMDSEALKNAASIAATGFNCQLQQRDGETSQIAI